MEVVVQEHMGGNSPLHPWNRQIHGGSLSLSLNSHDSYLEFPGSYANNKQQAKANSFASLLQSSSEASVNLWLEIKCWTKWILFQFTIPLFYFLSVSAFNTMPNWLRVVLHCKPQVKYVFCGPTELLSANISFAWDIPPESMLVLKLQVAQFLSAGSTYGSNKSCLHQMTHQIGIPF